MALFSFSAFLALFVFWYVSEKTKHEEAVSKEVVSRNILSACTFKSEVGQNSSQGQLFVNEFSRQTKL